MRMLLNRDDEILSKNMNAAGSGGAGTHGMDALPRRPTALRDDEVKRGLLRTSSTMSVRAVVRRVGSWLAGWRAGG